MNKEYMLEQINKLKVYTENSCTVTPNNTYRYSFETISKTEVIKLIEELDVKVDYINKKEGK